MADSVIGQAGPIANRMGARLVRNHAQRQVVALEIAIVAMTPYSHPIIMRWPSSVATRNWT